METQISKVPDTKQHPAWDVYDLYRTARLNVKYYSSRLDRLEKRNFWMELLLAISAPSSVVAGLWFWDTEAGAFIWKTLGALSAFLAVAKPILRLTDKIRSMEEVLCGYRALEHDLYKITVLIKQENQYDTKLQKRFQDILERKGILITKGVESREDRQLKMKCQEEVLTELPTESFYIPGGITNA